MTDEGHRRLRHLRRFGPMTAAQLAEATSAKRETVFQWLRRRPEVEQCGQLREAGAPRLFRVVS